MDKETIQIINDFNDTLLSLAQNIAYVCPSSIIGTNIKDIEKQIKRPTNFKKFIDLFCIKVLQYKDKIDAGDEDFFMQKDYDGDVKEIKEEHHNVLDHIITLKSVWQQLKKENKKIVIANMQILCALSGDYYLKIMC